MEIALGIGVILSLIIQDDFWKSFFEGASAVCLLVSIFNHAAFYKETKKLY
jgi:hypothetical protein